jgi:hypothetical protein
MRCPVIVKGSKVSCEKFDREQILCKVTGINCLILGEMKATKDKCL